MHSPRRAPAPSRRVHILVETIAPIVETRRDPGGLLDKEIQEAVNEQIRAELYSAYTYLGMSAHFAEQSFDGFAHWMRHQAQEEVQHAMRLYGYLLERGGHVNLRAVEAPPTKLGKPLEVFEAALADRG